MIEIARKIIKHAFKDKKDLAGAPYIDHLERVYEKVRDHHDSIKVVALLHDLIEDCEEWSLENLRPFFNETIIDSIDAITKKKNEHYPDYIERVSKDSYARTVKLSDLEDNMNVTRLKKLTDGDLRRLNKYLSAYHYLKKD